LFLKEGGREVGAAVLAPEHLIDIFVLPEFQRRGYGARLIEFSLRRLLSRGAKKVLVEIADSRALRIIEKLPEELTSSIWK
jgi:GNAT superfamily N-acetyltransferase